MPEIDVVLLAIGEFYGHSLPTTAIRFRVDNSAFLFFFCNAVHQQDRLAALHLGDQGKLPAMRTDHRCEGDIAKWMIVRGVSINAHGNRQG